MGDLGLGREEAGEGGGGGAGRGGGGGGGAGEAGGGEGKKSDLRGENTTMIIFYSELKYL